MPLSGAKNESCKLEEPSETIQDPFLCYPCLSNCENGSIPIILQQYVLDGTCTKVQKEASSVLFDRTPLRFIIGGSQSMSSAPPPQKIIERFTNVYFQIGKIGSTHPCYEFDVLFQPLTKALTLSPPQRPSVLLRRSCYIQCEIEEYAAGHSAAYLQRGLQSFTAFETVTIDFERRTQQARYGKHVVADKNSKDENAVHYYNVQERDRKKQPAGFAAVEKMFQILEQYLGKGRMLDLEEDWYLLYGRRLEFHPLLNKKEITNTTSTTSHEDA